MSKADFVFKSLYESRQPYNQRYFICSLRVKKKIGEIVANEKIKFLLLIPLCGIPEPNVSHFMAVCRSVCVSETIVFPLTTQT